MFGLRLSRTFNNTIRRNGLLTTSSPIRITARSAKQQNSFNTNSRVFRRNNSTKSSNNNNNTQSTNNNSSSNSSSGSNGSSGNAEKPKKGIKLLMSKYGYSALGVYLSISAIDLPLSFLLVHSVGPEKMEEWEIKIKGYLGISTDPKVQPATTTTILDSNDEHHAELHGRLHIDEDKDNTTLNGGELFDKKGEASSDDGKWFGIDKQLLAEFGIAYALHKSLIFVRVPLTAAITPAVVKLLQKWGFNVGKKVATTGAARFGTPANSKQRFGSWFF